MKEEHRDRSYLEHDLIFAAVMGIEDSIREGVPTSVTQAHEAGITVRMITGDHPGTAVVVSKRSNILPEDYEYTEGDGVVMTGKEFQEAVSWTWDDSEKGILSGEITDLEQFDEVQKKLRVIARSTF